MAIAFRKFYVHIEAGSDCLLRLLPNKTYQYLQMGSYRDIDFFAVDGVKLRGWFYNAGESRPCIIMSNGVSPIRSMALGRGRWADAKSWTVLWNQRSIPARFC